MIRALVVFYVIATVVMMGVAVADLTTTGAGISGSGSPPPPCGNDLNFGDACNSAYIVIF